MQQTAIKMKPAMNALLQSYKEQEGFMISSEEWKILEEISLNLKPFNYLSNLFGGASYVTLPLVVVGFNMLVDNIENITTNLDRKVDEKLLVSLQSGRDKMLKHYRKTNWVYGVVLILDPRHKIQTFLMTRWGCRKNP